MNGEAIIFLKIILNFQFQNEFIHVIRNGYQKLHIFISQVTVV